MFFATTRQAEVEVVGTPCECPRVVRVCRVRVQEKMFWSAWCAVLHAHARVGRLQLQGTQDKIRSEIGFRCVAILGRKRMGREIPCIFLRGERHPLLFFRLLQCGNWLLFLVLPGTRVGKCWWGNDSTLLYGPGEFDV